MLPREFALIAIYCFSLCCSFGQTQVNATAGLGQRDVRTSDTNPLPNGNAVWIGCFDPGFNVIANADNLQTLSSHWHLYGATAIITILGQGGRFTMSASNRSFF